MLLAVTRPMIAECLTIYISQVGEHMLFAETLSAKRKSKQPLAKALIWFLDLISSTSDNI